MILLIDNYDSFTFNLFQALASLGAEVKVCRNDQITLEEISALAPEKILLSPGPRTPKEAGICLPLIERFFKELPILGICLGHQAIAMALGGKIRQARQIVHGKTSEIGHLGEGIFAGLPNPFTATRYHSWVADEGSLPSALQITARAEDQEIMGLAHREYPLFGVQFHPESVLTVQGNKLLENFLRVRY